MKRIYTYIMLASVYLLSACTSLDMAPTSSISDANFWKSPEQFSAFMDGMHTQLRSSLYNIFLLGEGRSDMFGGEAYGGESSNGRDAIPKNLISESNPMVSNYAGLYNNINQANLLIYKSLETSVLSEEARNYLLGQAYGLRAFYYFHLLRSWGDVIIYTDPTLSISSTGLEKAVSSAADVMAQIKKDIQSSLDAFGNDYSFKGQKGQWSKAASLMLKAEAFLWSSRQMGGGVSDANEVKSALTDIKTHVPDLGLNEKFEDTFAYTKKGNKEIIFAVRYQTNEAVLFDGSYRQNFLPQNFYVKTYYKTDVAGNYSLIDPTVDNLLGQALFFVQLQNYTDFDPKDTRQRLSLRAMYEKQPDESYKLIGLTPWKFQGTNETGSSERSMVDDYPIYRYADWLLMMAEAKMIAGEDPASEINLVRERAFGNDYNAATMGYPHQAIDVDPERALLQERRFEFMMEAQRWYDLRRFGNKYVFEYTLADKSDPRKLLWPIDKTTLTNNRELNQTPGYEQKTAQ